MLNATLMYILLKQLVRNVNPRRAAEALGRRFHDDLRVAPKAP
jgi:hypothetical protein